MLEARTHAFSQTFTLHNDGIEVGSLESSSWSEKATLSLGGYSYSMYRKGMLSGVHRVVGAEGAVLAEASKSALRHNFEIDCAEGHFSLLRRAMMSSDYILQANNQEIGYVKKESMWRRDAVAEIAGLPLVPAFFIIWLALVSWQEETAAAAAAAH